MPHASVIGSGPNGLAAAITLAQAGWSVTLYEAKATVGGGLRTAELTLPGFHHDICSAIHPLGISSPFFKSLPLANYGLEWIYPEVNVAHPFDDGTAAYIARTWEETADSIGADGRGWRQLFEPLAANWDGLVRDFLRPIINIPRSPFTLAYFGLHAIQSARMLTNWRFRGERARALFAGNAAHVIQPLDYPLTAAFGIVLAGSAHAVGWGMPRGGSQSLADALTAHLRSLGGEVVTDTPIEDIDALPPSDAVMLDITPHQIADIAANHLPDGYLRALRRYRYGPGVFKVDWALSEPVPWTAKAARHAGTVHIGGTFDEIAVSEHAAYYGRVPREPYVLLAQQSIADPTRAPEGKHTLWAYCHVPHGSDADMTDVIENQIERFAPGFKDTILAKHTMNAPQMQAYNPNYIGGDINGGVQDIGQLFLRPTPRLQAYTTPNPSLFICSSASPPGGGVHGMAGYHAAQVALKNFN